MKYISLLFLILIITFITGCTERNNPGAHKKTSITIKGSDTMTLILNGLAEEFMKSHPSVEISIEGGGSNSGISGLLNKTIDIAAASKQIDDKELKLADEKSIDIKEHSIARDAIIIIVNPRNSVKELSLEEIEEIFTGTYNNWNQTGGANLPIFLCNHPSDSGSYMFFKEHILKQKNFSENAKVMGKPSDIVNTVIKESGSISYIGYQYYLIASDQVKALGVKSKSDSAAILPSEENIINGLYPISRTLYLYTSENTSKSAVQFIDFCTGPEGQNIMKKNDSIPVK